MAKIPIGGEKRGPSRRTVVLVPVAHAMLDTELANGIVYPETLLAGKASRAPHALDSGFCRLRSLGLGTGVGAVSPSYCPTQQSRSSRQHMR